MSRLFMSKASVRTCLLENRGRCTDWAFPTYNAQCHAQLYCYTIFCILLFIRFFYDLDSTRDMRGTRPKKVRFYNFREFW